VAILDGNVKRVLTRALGFDGDLAVATQERALWSHAEALLPAAGIERYTQGLMDLGATLCTARAPRCPACPLTADCAARIEGRPERFPVKTRKLKRGARRNALLWLVDAQDRWWLTQRPASGVWAGLWTMPVLDSVDAVNGLVDGWPGQGGALAPISHALTHFDWLLEPWRHTLPAGLDPSRLATIERALPAGGWHTREQALARGLPAPIRKLLAA
jgi:A/G-specific adenine glycosylase